MRRGGFVVGVAIALVGLGVCCAAARAQTPAETPRAAEYSPAHLYNQANADARAGKVALAVLEYERARVLAPADPDARENLRHARELAGVPAGPDDWFERYGRFANPNAMYWIGIAGLALGGGCLLMLRRRTPTRGALLAGMILGAAMVGASLVNAAATFPVLSEAVALEQAAAGVSPVEGADALFAVPAASTVRVLDRHQGFDLIRDSQGREGWVSAANLAPVIPSSAGNDSVSSRAAIR
ncbi:MAG TPA: hypothetical protein VHY75_14450 [Steroidobacteraceae bacterium]|jgi:hypothetical protein|nr:hypothetical protein [Steroidobacteraceae bacterium]